MLPGVELARRRRTRNFSEPRALHSYHSSTNTEDRSQRSTFTHQHHSNSQHHQRYSHRQQNEPVPRLRRSNRAGSNIQQLLPLIPENLQGIQDESANGMDAGRASGLQRNTPHIIRSLLRWQVEQNRLQQDLLRAPALEARYRLDERLRAAALGRQRNTDASLLSLAEHHFSTVSSDEDEIFGERAVSTRELLSASGPRSIHTWEPEQGIHDRGSAPLKGMSTSDLNSLPLEVFQQPVGDKHSETNCAVSKQAECSVCLESFMTGQILFHLPCGHTFHLQCLTPWLEAHSQCPNCRSKVSVTH